MSFNYGPDWSWNSQRETPKMTCLMIWAVCWRIWRRCLWIWTRRLRGKYISFSSRLHSKMWSFDEQLQCYLGQCGACFVTLSEEMCCYLLQASPWCRASQQWHSRAQQPSTWGKLARTKIASQMIPAYHHLFNLIMANAWSVHIVVKTLTCAQLPQSFDLKYKFM